MTTFVQPAVGVAQGLRRRQVAALLEVLGVYCGGQLLGVLLASLVGVELRNPLQDVTATTTPAQLGTIAVDLFVILFFQYAGWLLLAFAIGWWHRRRKPAQYGISTGGRSVPVLIGLGVVLFSFSELPAKILEVVAQSVDLGPGVPWREAIFEMSWSSPQFWALMFVGSFGLIPILEELFYRGYCQTRLEEDFGAPAAILGTAALFSFSHSQYLTLSPLNLSTMAALVFGAIVWGYAFYRTRSLLVVMVAHALVNLPLYGIWVWIAPVAMLAVLLLARKVLAAELPEARAVFSQRGRAPLAGLLFVMLGLFAVGMVTPGISDYLFLLGLLFLVVALVLHWLEKRDRKAIL